MRDSFATAMINLVSDPRFVFLTGDLGFGALEKLRDCAGNRFINAAVAEQNMISVAAGLANRGLRPWAYSIAPFVYARAFEQIRNDICLHNLPVTVVGNGGGYGYGVMGATHHAIEDYAVLGALQNMRIFVPAFKQDIGDCVAAIMKHSGPAYLRLGRCELPNEVEPPRYAPWRLLSEGNSGVMIVCGPVVATIMKSIQQIDITKRPALWLISEFESNAFTLSKELLAFISENRRVTVVEEHVVCGGIGTLVAAELLKSGISLESFKICNAKGYPSGLYGSQNFHRKECGLDGSVLTL
jgi:transketolase